MKYNFRKILSALTSVAMISSTVGLAAAANYPAPFVENGAANVAVVYGSSATLDLAAVTDITTSLNAKITAQVGSTSSQSSNVTGGDSVLLAKNQDSLNLGDYVDTVFGATVDDGDLKTLLADGTYKNDKNSEFPYTQKITLGHHRLAYFSDRDYEDEEPSIGIQLSSRDTFVMNYTLDFTTDAESDITGGDLVDLETTLLPILGKSYYVSDVDNSTTKFTLLDTANTATVNEGETTTVVVGSKTYEVTTEWIKTNKVKLNVNGVLTNDLAEGDSYNLGDGSYVGVKSIFQRDVAGITGNVEFSIGSGKLELEGSSNEVELNDEIVPEVKAYIERTETSGKVKIQKVVLQWKTDAEEYIAPKSELTMPGFNAVKFKTGPFVVPETEKVIVASNGDDTFELSAPIKSGLAKFDILSTNASGEFVRIGSDSATDLLYTSGTNKLAINLSNGDTFVATYNTTDDAESYLLRLSSSSIGSTSNKTTISDSIGTGSCAVVYTGSSEECGFGDVDLTITQIGYIGNDIFVNITAGTNVNFNTLFTEKGLKIYLPYEAANTSTGMGAINFSTLASTAGHNSGSFYLYMAEEDKDDNKASGTTFNMTLNDDANGKVTVSDMDSGQSEYKVINTDGDYTTRVYSDLATEVKLVESSNDRMNAEILYSGEEAYGEVYITAPGAVIGGTTGGVVSLKDSEVAQAAGKNLIVVGGSCVNTVAAELLGGALCGSDFTAATNVAAGEFLIKSFAREGKIATMVAGYNAGDTQNAAKALTTQAVDTSAGMAYKGSSATTISSVTEAA